ncbi:hypothetical protein QSV34_02160 [Porticoccus sp. W117]|uniref:hypothetical protein n=1 Tax=Porticoccus sp. W117 TaxID=3054777 RepID=UPI002593B0D8|nr:hypothetical protein [Porticoccus sp. W117]MDM3870153.1 hypothetical protein [Porticoccus sp. W117]
MDIAVASIIEVTGLGVFIYYLFRSLSAKINSLEGVINAQKQTIDVMDKRIEETEKVGGIYKNLISDLPEDIDNYKTIISKTKDDVILELKTKNEEVEVKLKEAREIIQRSGDPKEEVNLHLSVLKNLLSEPALEDSHFKKEYDLKAIAEFGGRAIEQSIAGIVKSKTLDEYFHLMGFDVTITDDDSVIKEIFSDERKLPNGERIESAMVNHSVSGGWHILANNKAWINDVRLNELKDEFSAIKTVT